MQEPLFSILTDHYFQFLLLLRAWVCLQGCRAPQRALGAEAACPCHHLRVLQAADTPGEAAWGETPSKSPLLLALPVCGVEVCKEELIRKAVMAGSRSEYWALQVD